ncbi:MAG: ectonucleotide pyrophosphatase/phosphodiesterase, partial [Balneolaceae bacterium]
MFKNSISNLKGNLIIFSLMSLMLFSGCSQEEKDPNPLLLISFDGFKHDYFEKTDTPNFDRFISNGVKAEGLISVFPTKTFPNHYTIVTGLYPENSGLVSNNMYDHEMDATYAIRDREAVENPDWYEGEPIWNTAEKNGLKAGTLFWVGSEAPIQNMRPSHWKIYDSSFPEKARIDTVMKWLTRADLPPVHFSTLYFSDVDSKGHRYGIKSDSIITAIQNADYLLGYLMDRIDEKNLADKLNIIIVSDHGMAELSADKVILIDEIIDLSKVQMVDWSPVAMINPGPGYLEEAYQALKANEEFGYRAFKKQELPERFRLKNHHRTPELIVIADVGYTITTNQRLNRFVSSLPSATHGFDNMEPDMFGIFLAGGPAFKNGYETGLIENIHIYELMTH